jgi:hypothetical protein
MYYSNILLAFFVLALYTTFHAATRTYFTPLFLGLSMLTIINNRKKEITTSKEIALKNNTELNDSPLGDALSSAKRVSDSL